MNAFKEWNNKIDEAENFGFNFAYKLRDDAKDMSAAETLQIVSKLKNNWHKIGGAEGGLNGNAEQYIATDLAAVCASISPETPEMAANLLNMTKDLFSYNKGSEGLAAYKLETYNKQARYLGDEKVAAAYVGATAQSFAQMEGAYDRALPALNRYIEIAKTHAELSGKILDTVLDLKGKSDVIASEDYKRCINEVLNAITANSMVDKNIKTKAGQNIMPDNSALKTNERDKNVDKPVKHNLWKRIKNKVQGFFKNEKTVEIKGITKQQNAKMAALINAKRFSNSHNLNFSEQSQHRDSQTRARIVELRGGASVSNNKILAEKPQERQVQVHSDAYNALETYARISAMEEMSGVAGFAYNGMDKNKCMDILKQVPPAELSAAVGEFKSNAEKNPLGNADFTAKTLAAAEKLPEQLNLSPQKENKYSKLDDGQFRVAMGAAYENFARIEHFNTPDNLKNEVLNEAKLVLEEAKRRYPNAGEIPPLGTYFKDADVAKMEQQFMPYMREAAKNDKVLAADVNCFEAWRNGRDAEITGSSLKVTEMPYANFTRFGHRDKEFTPEKCHFHNPLECGQRVMSDVMLKQQKELLGKLNIR